MGGCPGCAAIGASYSACISILALLCEVGTLIGTMRAPGVSVPPDAGSQGAAPSEGAGAGGELMAGGAYAAVAVGAASVGGGG